MTKEKAIMAFRSITKVGRWFL